MRPCRRCRQEHVSDPTRRHCAYCIMRWLVSKTIDTKKSPVLDPVYTRKYFKDAIAVRRLGYVGLRHSTFGGPGRCCRYE